MIEIEFDVIGTKCSDCKNIDGFELLNIRTPSGLIKRNMQQHIYCCRYCGYLILFEYLKAKENDNQY